MCVSLILEKYCGNIFDLCVCDGEGWYKVTYQRVWSVKKYLTFITGPGGTLIFIIASQAALGINSINISHSVAGRQVLIIRIITLIRM